MGSSTEPLSMLDTMSPPRHRRHGRQQHYRNGQRRPKKTYLDLLRFLLTMRRELATSEMHKYDGFLAAMRALKDRRMDIAGLDTYVKALLAGHPELIRRFSEFLPWDYIRSQGPAAGGQWHLNNLLGEWLLARRFY